MKRAIVIVIDSMGCGAMADCKEYGDVPECNTLCNVAAAVGGLKAPNFYSMGLGNLGKVAGINKNEKAIAQYGIMKETSKGKDTTTGHWEMMGLILDNPFKVYPNGFPSEIIDKFIQSFSLFSFLHNFIRIETSEIKSISFFLIDIFFIYLMS